MSLLALNNALTGIKTHQAALGVISNNIANANTEGYVRKVAQLESLVLGAQGAGVQIGDIQRQVDERLLAQRRRELGELSRVQVIDDYYQDIQQFFGQPADNNSISAEITGLVTVIEDYTLNPEDFFNAEEVIRQAQDVTTRLQQMYQDTQMLRAEADRTIGDRVNEINGLLDQIDTLNVRVVQNQHRAQDTGELRDQRDVALNRLAELIDITTFERSNGDVAVSTVGGRILVDVDARVLTHVQPNDLTGEIAYDPDRATPPPPLTQGAIGGIFLGDQTITSNDITGDIRSGELRGLIELRDTILPQFQEQMDGLTRQLRDLVNAAHNLGTTFPPPDELNGTRQFLDEAGNVISDATNVNLNMTGVIRVAVVVQEPASQRGNLFNNAGVNQVATIDLDQIRQDTAGSLTLDEVIAEINTQLAGSATAAYSNGRLSIRADSDANGVIVDQPSNLVRSLEVDDATVDLTAAGPTAVPVANGDNFQITDANGVVLGTVTYDTGDTLESLRNEINLIDGVTARIQTSSAGGAQSRIEITKDDGAALNFVDITGDLARELGFTTARSGILERGSSTIPAGLVGQQLTVTTTVGTFTTPAGGFAATDTVDTVVAALNALDASVNARFVNLPGGGGYIEVFDGTGAGATVDGTAAAVSALGFANQTNTRSAAIETTVLSSGVPLPDQFLGRFDGVQTDPNTTYGFTVDGTAVTFNATTDTLEDVAASINAIAGVTARIVNQDGFRIEITRNDGVVPVLETSAGLNDDGLSFLGFTTTNDEDIKGFSHYFGLNDFFVDDGGFNVTESIEVAGRLVDDAGLLTRGQLSRSLDTDNFTGATVTAVTSGNDDGARILADMFLENVGDAENIGNTLLISSGPFEALGDLPQLDVTITEYATRILANNSLNASLNQSEVDFQTEVVNELQFRIDEVSAVNLDEELSNMILFQNAFTASARVITTTQQILDELVDLVR